MAFENHQQLLTTFERAERPLIVLSEHADADDFVSAFGIALLLAKLGKPTQIVTSGGRLPTSLEFLPHKQPVRGDLANIRQLTLKVSGRHAKIDELSYDIVDGDIHIRLIPKTGAWTKEDVSIETDQYKFDLVITIGVRDLSQLGELYKKYADFFFQSAIVNIDHHPSNEYFGAINVVDINTSATSEVCFDLFKKLDDTLVDGEMATLLLTGMIFKTKSFRASNVTPKTLKVASELIARGARRDEIVEHLYKTRTVETLRLWGRALARLKSDDHLVWTLLTRQDFVAAGIDESALENVIDELIVTSPNANVAAVFYEGASGGIEVILHAEKPQDALYLGAPFGASGTRESAKLHVKEPDIVKAEKKVITHIREQLKKSS